MSLCNLRVSVVKLGWEKSTTEARRSTQTQGNEIDVMRQVTPCKNYATPIHDLRFTIHQ
jgi:hypothetical protein